VTVKAPVESVLLGEGRQIYVEAALELEDPFKRVVDWPDDFRTTDLDAYDRYKARSPKMASLPVFGSPNQGGFSAEKAIALKPDVVILSLDGYRPSKEIIVPQLEKAGIPTVVDFRQYPFENTVPSAILMGKLFGREARAQQLVDFYIKHINRVYDRVEEIEKSRKQKPLAFIYRAAGSGDCCGTFGRGNMGLFVERARGVNLGSETLPGWSGTVNPESVGRRFLWTLGTNAGRSDNNDPLPRERPASAQGHRLGHPVAHGPDGRGGWCLSCHCWR
jgi:iron complex transport system substrate-binding protein